MDKLQAMSTFVRIADLGSLTAAAAALDKSLPTVVRLLASLERSLHTRLFNRSTRHIALTEEGKHYLTQCRKILADIDDLERTLGMAPVTPRGLITLTAPVGFGQLHVAPAVNEFLQRYPETEVNLLLLDRVVDMMEEGLDLAVRIAPLVDSTFVARPLGMLRQVVCASPELLERVGEPQHPRELGQRPCVRFTGMGGAHWPFRHGEKTFTVAVRGAFTCNHVGASIHACLAHQGFGRFLSYQVAAEVARGDLRIVLRDYEPEPLPVSLVYPHARLVSARVRALIDWLQQALSARLTSGLGGL